MVKNMVIPVGQETAYSAIAHNLVESHKGPLGERAISWRKDGDLEVIRIQNIFHRILLLIRQLIGNIDVNGGQDQARHFVRESASYLLGVVTELKRQPEEMGFRDWVSSSHLTIEACANYLAEMRSEEGRALRAGLFEPQGDEAFEGVLDRLEQARTDLIHASAWELLRRARELVDAEVEDFKGWVDECRDHSEMCAGYVAFMSEGSGRQLWGSAAEADQTHRELVARLHGAKVEIDQEIDKEVGAELEAYTNPMVKYLGLRAYEKLLGRRVPIDIKSPVSQIMAHGFSALVIEKLDFERHGELRMQVAEVRCTNLPGKEEIVAEWDRVERKLRAAAVVHLAEIEEGLEWNQKAQEGVDAERAMVPSLKSPEEALSQAIKEHLQIVTPEGFHKAVDGDLVALKAHLMLLAHIGQLGMVPVEGMDVAIEGIVGFAEELGSSWKPAKREVLGLNSADIRSLAKLTKSELARYGSDKVDHAAYNAWCEQIVKGAGHIVQHQATARTVGRGEQILVKGWLERLRKRGNQLAARKRELEADKARMETLL